jgi:hypothetical protein
VSAGLVGRLHELADGDQLLDAEIVDEASLLESIQMRIDGGWDVGSESQAIIYLLTLGWLRDHAITRDRIVGAVEAITNQAAAEAIHLGASAITRVHFWISLPVFTPAGRGLG